MEIVNYPHPTLRHVSKPIKRVDAELRKIVDEMFELMYQANGIGLAANQVNLPLRMFVANTAGDPEEGEPHVFLNPVFNRPKGSVEKEEGCLSMPDLYGGVKRPEKIFVTAYSLQGEEFSGEIDGIMARVVQHEVDHLDGILFTDRLSETGKMAAASSLEQFEDDFADQRAEGTIPDDAEIAAHLAEFEKRYC